MKLAIATLLVGSAAAFAPQASVRSSTSISQHIGSGGMADTRVVEASEHEDPRKSISAAPSFEEYLKQRAGGDAAAPAAPAAAAPAAAAPAAAAGGGGGDLIGTLKTMEGPGQVWGHEGIPFGHEELDLKGYENFGKFVAALESTGVAAELASGEFTIFAPTDPAMETYEVTRGPITADVIKKHIVPGKIASADVPTADLNSLGGPLNYRYAVRKHFVNDAIIGESTFGPFSDYPVDVQCSNGVIHAVGLNFAM